MHQRIPKKIHYCWFGGNEFPEIISKCIDSWKEVLPDYELILWNEENFDINHNNYVKEAYESKKFAFVSDYVRLYALYNYGGIYLDTDVEVLKSFDDFLNHESFSGFEGKDSKVAFGLAVGTVKKNKLILEIMNTYENTNFIKESGELELSTIVNRTTEILKKYGLKQNGKLQEVSGMTIYPTEYFAPELSKINDRKKLSSNTYSIHHYAASWVDDEYKNRMKKLHWKIISNVTNKASKFIKKIIGENKFIYIRNRYFSKLYKSLKG